MSGVAMLQTRFGVTPTLVRKTEAFEQDLREAISLAKDEGIPQGIIVALLQAHLHMQTQELCDGG